MLACVELQGVDRRLRALAQHPGHGSLPDGQLTLTMRVIRPKDLLQAHPAREMDGELHGRLELGGLGERSGELAPDLGQLPPGAVEEVLDLRGREREEYLDRVCGDDSALRNEVLVYLSYAVGPTLDQDPDDGTARETEEEPTP